MRGCVQAPAIFVAFLLVAILGQQGKKETKMQKTAPKSNPLAETPAKAPKTLSSHHIDLKSHPIDLQDEDFAWSDDEDENVNNNQAHSSIKVDTARVPTATEPVPAGPAAPAANGNHMANSSSTNGSRPTVVDVTPKTGKHTQGFYAAITSYKPGSSATQKRSAAGTSAGTSSGLGDSSSDNISTSSAPGSAAGKMTSTWKLAAHQARSGNMVFNTSGTSLRFDDKSLANNVRGTAGYKSFIYTPGSNRVNNPSSPSSVVGSGFMDDMCFESVLPAGMAGMGGDSMSMSRASSGSGDSGSISTGGYPCDSDRDSYSSDGGSNNTGKSTFKISNQTYIRRGFGMTNNGSGSQVVINGIKNSFGAPVLQLPAQASGDAAEGVDSPRGHSKDQEKARSVYEKGSNSKAPLLAASGSNSGDMKASLGDAKVEALLPVETSIKSVQGEVGNSSMGASFGSFGYVELCSSVLLLVVLSVIIMMDGMLCAAARAVQPVATAALAASVAASLMPAAKDAAAGAARNLKAMAMRETKKESTH